MPEFSRAVEDAVPGGLRLDRYVAEYLGLLSRSQIKARSLTGKINGKTVKLSRPVKRGDLVELVWNEAPPLFIIPEDIPLDLIYEDERAVVVNKAQGMVVHPGAGNRRGTLANALYFRRLARRGAAVTQDVFSPSLRPGIVHRLDKETSGVIIAAYDDAALAFLAEQFKARRVKKTYAAIISGALEKKQGRIETYIARDSGNRKRFTVSDRGKIALTCYKVVKTWSGHSLVLLCPKTGRTHQLRVHLRGLGHPITGDGVYGFADRLFPGASLMLHAKSLAITLPGHSEARTFRAPLPERFITMIRRLDKRG
jgi:23S rRNA pseudouridine1911/1915/1917 synthase